MNIIVLLLIVLLFRWVGAVHLDKTLAGLQEKYTFSRLHRDDRRTFEHLQLRFRQVHSFEQWWQAICEAGCRMNFAWLALKTTHADGRIEEELWRAPNSQPNGSRVITTTIPLGNGNGHADVSRQFEIAIWANGSVEAASRRVTLFGRLLDESEAVISS